jgi:hypothetical protein
LGDKTQIFYSGDFCTQLKNFTTGTFAHFWGPQTQNLGAKTQNLYSGVFCPKLKIWGPKLKIFTPGSFAPNTKFLLQGLLPTFGGLKLKISGPKLKIFTPVSFAPNFLHLKSFLAGQRFHNDDIKEAVTTCFASQAASFYNKGIQKLVQRYDKCLNGGNYVKK